MTKPKVIIEIEADAADLSHIDNYIGRARLNDYETPKAVKTLHDAIWRAVRQQRHKEMTLGEL